MEVVVNDTNILIDLFNAGLLPYCKKLNLSFRTLDVVINEIETPEQHAAVQQIIDEGTLSVHSLSSKQMDDVFRRVAEYHGGDLATSCATGRKDALICARLNWHVLRQRIFREEGMPSRGMF